MVVKLRDMGMGWFGFLGFPNNKIMPPKKKGKKGDKEEASDNAGTGGIRNLTAKYIDSKKRFLTISPHSDVSAGGKGEEDDKRTVEYYQLKMQDLNEKMERM